MEEQQLERAKERKKKEAEGRKVPKQELSKLEKETFVTQGDTHELEEGIFISKKKREALKLKSSSPRFKSMDDKNVEYIKPVTVMRPSTKWDKEGTLDIPRPKAKGVVMKLLDEVETRKRIEPVKSKVEFSTVNEGKTEREKISIEAVKAPISYSKAEGTTERDILKVHAKEFINELKFEKRELKIPKNVENGREILKELECEKYSIEGKTVGKTEDLPSFEGFGYIKKDKEIWITDSKTGLPSDALLFLIIGRKGAGLEVLSGLLQLELRDRGRQPNPQILLPPENAIKRAIKNHEAKFVKIEDIADDYYKFFRLIWAEDYPLKYLKDEPELRNEVYKALRKGVLKYVVFTIVPEKVEEIDLDKNEKRLSEEVKKEFEEIFHEFGNLSIINLNKIPSSEGQLKELGQTFAKILQVAKSKFKIDSEISNILKRKKFVEWSIDALWQSTWDKKNSALNVLFDKYTNNPEIRRILPPRAQLQNESEEHFVIKQLIVKDLLKRGKKKWIIQPETREAEGSLKKWDPQSVQEDFSEEIKVEKDAKDKEGETIKRPDLTITTDGRESIWIEIETCKNIKDPLMFVKDKLRKLKEIEDYEPPDELWLVFPYRKFFLYGSEQFKEMFIDDFNNFRRLNQIEKLKPRVFFSDLYNEQLVELKEEEIFNSEKE